MKTEFLSFIRLLLNFNEKDVFKRTQGRLTRIYSGLLILFLVLFVVIVYSLLNIIIFKTQERDLQSLVNQEAGFLENYLAKNDQRDLLHFQNQNVVFAGADQFFYYVVDQNGQVEMGNESNPRLRPDLLRLVNRRFANNKIHQETLDMRPLRRGHSRNEFQPAEGSRVIHLLIASHTIYNNGQFIGSLYIGKDISFTYQLLSWVLKVLLALGVIFLGVAVYISSVMSKRAMIPISNAFSRQREFVADASHELRTPLSVLLSSVDAMEMTVEVERDSFVQKLISNMREEVKRMTSLVSDLLTLARFDSSALEVKKEKVDFRILAEKAIESFGPLAESKQIQLKYHSPDSVTAAGDPQRLSQLLVILLDNAIKYTPDGGKVDLLLEKGEKSILIKVQDTGIGIGPEDAKHIFERFYRAEKSRSREIGGYGLGLSIAKWIVDAHSGTIQLESEAGKGSTFIIKILR